MGKNNKGGNKQPVNKKEEATWTDLENDSKFSLPEQEEKQVEPEEKIITA